MFKDNSDACIKALQQAQEAALRAIGELIYSAVYPLIPKDTTALANSLDYEVDTSEMSVTIGVNTDYAIYVEFGTGIYAENGQGRKGGWFYTDGDGNGHFTQGNKPQPYLRPGYKSNVENIKKIIENYLKEYIGNDFKVTMKKV